jgi:hypothetical protein
LSRCYIRRPAERERERQTISIGAPRDIKGPKITRCTYVFIHIAKWVSENPYIRTQ